MRRPDQLKYLLKLGSYLLVASLAITGTMAIRSKQNVPAPTLHNCKVFVSESQDIVSIHIDCPNEELAHQVNYLLAVEAELEANSCNAEDDDFSQDGQNGKWIAWRRQGNIWQRVQVP